MRGAPSLNPPPLDPALVAFPGRRGKNRSPHAGTGSWIILLCKQEFDSTGGKLWDIYYLAPRLCRKGHTMKPLKFGVGKNYVYYWFV